MEEKNGSFVRFFFPSLGGGLQNYILLAYNNNMKEYTFDMHVYTQHIICYIKKNSNYHAYYKFHDRFRTKLHTCNEYDTFYKLSLYQNVSFKILGVFPDTCNYNHV